MKSIFVCRPLPLPALELLRSIAGSECVTVFPEEEAIPREELLRRVPGTTALLPILTERVDEEVFAAAGHNLRIVANYAVGYNNIDVAAATARGIIVTNTPGVLTETTADLAWTLILAAARRSGEGERYLREGRWKSWGPMLLLGCDVHGKTLGIFGMGRIGRAVARRARAFGMRVLYCSPGTLSADEAAEFGAEKTAKADMLAEADFISIHCPLLDETRHAFGAAEFAAMKKTAILINTARGPIVDEAALVEALQTGQIAGAGLDVFEEEPRIHPGLLACENAVLLPHLGSATLETRTKMALIAAENIVAFLRGERPPNCVNPEVLA